MPKTCPSTARVFSCVRRTTTHTQRLHLVATNMSSGRPTRRTRSGVAAPLTGRKRATPSGANAPINQAPAKKKRHAHERADRNPTRRQSTQASSASGAQLRGTGSNGRKQEEASREKSNGSSDEETSDEETAGVEVVPPKGRAQKRCRRCGEAGHNARTHDRLMRERNARERNARVMILSDSDDGDGKNRV